jgi:hypothetical protein
MWMIELATNTNTADSRTGSHNAASDDIATSSSRGDAYGDGRAGVEGQGSGAGR